MGDTQSTLECETMVEEGRMRDSKSPLTEGMGGTRSPCHSGEGENEEENEE